METLKDKIIAKQDELIEILKRQIHVSGLLYPPSKVMKDMNRLEELESELSRLKDEGEDFTKPVLSVDKITDIKPAEQSDKLTAEEIIKSYPELESFFNEPEFNSMVEAMEAYHSQFVGEKVTDETQYEKSLRLIDEYFAETPKEEIQKLIDKYDSRPKWRRILDKLI